MYLSSPACLNYNLNKYLAIKVSSNVLWLQMYTGFCMGNFHSQFGTLPTHYKLLVLLNNIFKFLEKQSAVNEAGTSREVIVLLEYFYYFVSKIKEKPSCITQAFPPGPKNHGLEFHLSWYSYTSALMDKILVSWMTAFIHCEQLDVMLRLYHVQ